MEPFATAREMAERTNGAIPADTPFLHWELMGASRSIRNECGWHVAPLMPLTLSRLGQFPCQVWLPAMEIDSITSATVDGSVLDVAAIELDRATGWTNIVGRRVSIQYLAGFEDIPDDLVTLTLELASGGLFAREGIAREQAGSVSVTLSRTSAGLTPADIARLSAYRLGRLP